MSALHDDATAHKTPLSLAHCCASVFLRDIYSKWFGTRIDHRFFCNARLPRRPPTRQFAFKSYMECTCTRVEMYATEIAQVSADKLHSQPLVRFVPAGVNRMPDNGPLDCGPCVNERGGWEGCGVGSVFPSSIIRAGKTRRFIIFWSNLYNKTNMIPL